MNNRETRIFTGLKVEARADAEALPTIRGYAAVFNSETVIGGKSWGFREKIAPGAFADALKSSDVKALFNHNDDFVLGRASSGTLRLSEDDHGLRIEIDPPPTQSARDLITSMQRGDINQMSFAFTLADDGDEWDRSGNMPLRTIRKVAELVDVSVVTNPAYPDTEAAARSLAAIENEMKRQNFMNAARRLERKASAEQRFRNI